MNQNLFSKDNDENPEKMIKPDWDKIELDYRAGIKTLRQIGGGHGITEAAVRKRARRDGWTRDLSVRIEEKAQELVRKSEVRKSEVRRKVVRKVDSANHERLIVDVCGQGRADILLEHREAFQRNQKMIECLELELEDFQGGLSEKAKIAKMLTETRRMVVEMQRQAWGMDPKLGGARPEPEDRTDAVALLSGTIERLVAVQQSQIAAGFPAHEVVAALGAS